MATLEQLSAALVKADAAGNTEDARAFAAEIRKMRASETQPKEKPSFGSMLKEEVMGSVPVQTALGALRGAGSIGATLKAPFDYAEQGIASLMGADMPAPDRRTAMTEALHGMGAKPESIPFQVGKIGTEIAGTLGTGQALAGGLSAIPQVAQRAPGFIQAVRTAGMQGPNLGARIAGGAVTGGAAAGLVNPQEAGMGAAIGGALPAAVSAAKGLRSLAGNVAGLQTGAGKEAFTQAYEAGKKGGKSAESFTAAMRGKNDPGEVVAMARQNLDDIRQANQTAYRSGMVDIKKDKSILDFTGINKALDDAVQSVTFKGQIKAPGAADKLKQVYQEIDGWKQLPPNEYHTPEGLDALKQRIGDILESIPYNEQNSRRVVGNIYNSIKGEISKQAPEYTKVMKGYAEGAELVREIEKSLSLGKNAADETALRKLQSLMRNNVATSYGFRGQLAQELQSRGQNELLPTIAGQSLNELAPRGLARLSAAPGAVAGYVAGGFPAAVAGAAVSSPRLMGEAAFKGGQAARYLDAPIMNQLYQNIYRGAPVAGAQ